MPGALIVFSGIDGAGKSSQIDLLSRALEKKGSRTYVVWARGGYTPIISRLKRVLGYSMPIGGNYRATEKNAARETAFGNALVRWLWIRLAEAELLWMWAVMFRIRKWMGTVIIADRFVLDTKIDFLLKFDRWDPDRDLLWKLLEKMLLEPVEAFMLLVPVSVSMGRSDLKGEPFREGEATLARRLQLYESLCNEDKYQVIDGRQDFGVVHNMICRAVDQAVM